MFLLGYFTLKVSSEGTPPRYLNPSLIGVVVGGLLTLSVQYILHRMTEKAARRRESRTRIVNAHAKLAALASRDLDRARNVEAVVALSRPHKGDAGFEDWCACLSGLGRKRDWLRERLTAAQFRCLLYERNGQLQEAVEHLSQKQPFIIPLRDWSSDSYQDSLLRYRTQINDYETALHALCKMVRERYGD